MRGEPVADTGAAAVVCVTVIAAPWAFGAVEPLWWSLAALGCLLPVAALLLRDAARGGDRFVPRDAEWLVLALAVLPLLSLIPAPQALVTLLSPGYASLLEIIGSVGPVGPLEGAAEAAWVPLSTTPRETWHAALVAASAAAVFWTLARAGRDAANARVFTRMLLLGGAALALFGLVQRFVDHRSQAIYWVIPLSEVGTPFGPFVNRNHFGAAMCVFVGLAAGEFFHAIGTSRRRHAVLPGGVLLLVVVALVATTSRGAILGLCVTVIAIGTMTRARSRWKLILAAAGGLLLVLVALQLLGALGKLDRLFHVYGRWQHRFAVQLDALRVATRFPVFGTGAGSFEEIYPPFQSVQDVRRMSNAHSDWAQFAMETGAAGGLLLVAIVWRFLRRTTRLLLSESPQRWPVAGPVAAAAGLFVHGFFDSNLHIPSNALLMAATLSLAYSACLRSTAETAPGGALSVNVARAGGDADSADRPRE